MSRFLAKQPNGKYCCFSTVLDTVTRFNLTAEEYIQMRVKEAEKQAIQEIVNPEPFSRVIEEFLPNNDSVKHFNRVLEAMGSNTRINSDDY